MSLTTIITTLTTALEADDGPNLTVRDYAPDGQYEFPCALILHQTPAIEYDFTMGNGAQAYHLRVIVLVSRPAQESAAWDDLETYLNPTSTQSVKAAVASAFTNGRVTAAEAVGRIELNGVAYWGCAFLVNIWAA